MRGSGGFGERMSALLLHPHSTCWDFPLTTSCPVSLGLKQLTLDVRSLLGACCSQLAWMEAVRSDRGMEVKQGKGRREEEWLGRGK